MRFVAAWRAANPIPPSPEAKNDLHVEAMAAGTSLNLGCYVDAWRWSASADLRGRMASAYGSGNPFCADPDTDSFSRLTGDCDEGDPAVSPAAVETANQRDDDCDGRVDDLPAAEPPAGDFPHLQPVAYPADITGRILDGDADRFTFQIPSARSVRVELCPDPDFRGWVFVFNRDGGWRGYQYSGEDCSSQTYALDDGGTWEFSVELNTVSQPGRYRVQLFEPDPLPAPPWAATSSRGLCDGSYALTAASAGAAGATEVRFWVSGIGLVGSVPYEPLSGIAWTPPAGFDPALHKLRAQALAAGLPVTPFTDLATLDGGTSCQPLAFYTLAPCRLLDTRVDGPAPVSGAERILLTHGRCGIPSTARALVANVTVTQGSSTGHLTFYPGGAPLPTVSAINFRAGQTRANNAILPLSANGDGRLALRPFLVDEGAVHVILDVSGYFE